MALGVKMESNPSAKSQILKTANKLFLADGYQATTLRKIALESGVNYGSLTFLFKNKELIVCELIGLVINCQYETVNILLSNRKSDKILHYAVETVLQLSIAESSEHLREMYNVSYSMPNSSKVVYDNVAKKLQYIFSDYLTDFEIKDFYELEIALGGVMRSFLAIPCDMYFTFDRKITRFLETVLLICRVPDSTIKEIISLVKTFDFDMLVKATMDGLQSYIESKI